MGGNVFVNGTFDILHPGHIRLLAYARTLGSRLFVGIDTDERVKELKGPGRPVNTFTVRREMLMALKSVDEVMVFGSDQELAMLIKQIKPSIMVVGSDYKDKRVIGSEYAKKLIFYERITEYSTTNTIQGIVNRG